MDWGILLLIAKGAGALKTSTDRACPSACVESMQRLRTMLPSASHHQTPGHFTANNLSAALMIWLIRFTMSFACGFIVYVR